MNRIEKVRPDVTVFTGRYLIADNRLYRPYQLHVHELDELVNHVIQSTDRPIYYTNDFPNKYARDRYGLYTKVNKNRNATDADRIILAPGFISLFKRWGQKRILVNTWDVMHYNLLMSDYCDLLLTAEYSNNGNTNIMDLTGAIDFACDNYQGVLNRLQFSLQDPATTPAVLERLLNKAQAYRDQAFTKEELSRLDYNFGLYYLRRGDKHQAQTSFTASYTAWPHPDNPSKAMFPRIQ